MPKKPETKIIKQGKVDTEEIPLIKEKPRIVFRLFECLTHLEIATLEVSKVGIFLGDENGIRGRLAAVNQELKSLTETYRKLWAEMQQKGS